MPDTQAPPPHRPAVRRQEGFSCRDSGHSRLAHIDVHYHPAETAKAPDTEAFDAYP